MTDAAVVSATTGRQKPSRQQVWDFATAWFLALDMHAPEETCLAFLADDGLKMIFPEQTLEGTGDFRAWYRGGICADGTTMPGVVNVFFDENHTLKHVDVAPVEEGVMADVLVGWQASWFVPPAAKSRRTSLDAVQRWTLRPCKPTKNSFGMEIVGYDAMAEPFRYGPGFAAL
ncbi:MAG TPA: hypothetical protein VF171_07840 [Trueperaceae bacterium]